MKITTPAGKLADALSLIVAMTRVGKDSFPAVHLTAEGSGLSIRCADKSVGVIEVRIFAQADEPGQVALSADRLIGLAASFPPHAKVTITTTPNSAQINCRNSRSRLAAIPLHTMVSAPVITDEIARITIKTGDLLHLFRTIAAAGTEDSRYYLASCFLHSAGGQLIAVASDGRRLLEASIVADQLSTDRSLIIHSKTVAVLRRLLTQAKPSAVTIRRSRNLIEFQASGFAFTAPLIGGVEYPLYEHVVPPAGSNSVVCNRSELLAGLARLAAANTAKAPLALVALSWSKGALLDIFLAREPQAGADAISAKVRGRARAVLPLDQLANMISQFNGDHIRLEIGDSTDQPPVVFEGEGLIGVVVQAKFAFEGTGDVAA